MIARVDAAAYGVLLLDLLLRIQMIANPRKTCNSHLIDTHNQKPVLWYCLRLFAVVFFCRVVGIVYANFPCYNFYM